MLHARRPERTQPDKRFFASLGRPRFLSVGVVAVAVLGLVACAGQPMVAQEPVAGAGFATEPVADARVAAAPAQAAGSPGLPGAQQPKERRTPAYRVRPSERAWGEFASTYQCRTRQVTIGRMGVGMRLTDGADVFNLDSVDGGTGQRFSGSSPTGTASVTVSGTGAAVMVNGQSLGACVLTRQWPMASFRATGHEPAWLFKGELELQHWTIADKLFSVNVLDDQPMALNQPFSMGTEPGVPVLRVSHRVCRDSATGMPFPYTVDVLFEGRTLKGCGGTPSSLLLGREWVVTDVGTPSGRQGVAAGWPLSPLGHNVTIRFDGKGRVTGTAHCNLFSGIYALTAERLSIGSVAATRRACPGTAMQEEQAFLRALETVVGFDVSPAGELTLITRDAAERGVVAGIRAR